ncbi:MAG: hypothetical protein A3J10_01545 [Candidatus Sungbacteria bacterium RIFCSPLOWO2_02_FULL_54_10]|uniref:DUF1003 domain-containing protein n=2 Tax=Candidatus Sungiibacteriota TaxID=1817917 RepID=A0A1G2L9F6_9BACT|nr:MAG: hypothetical protein A2679_03865 [Candidatus Sungbacteria bacterium RIFCSPHIGHO2_01_FULL_54_26]OHA02610.1 MAG: hypothetical protein A3C92_03125 [Candidatus Sungbacteria bacterium RIFCSPHIGHO2_02_FULL_53_17]OHA07409.1 MAG: hypothetical protein A3B34_03060 [Candidatus Sungbacteria bacterium RIFCSPLOWO2_01_FULL_54_21]OHA12478.1 MAG: hypothetical protein A3J10_01545 [Candidatus Sungbacteria bacterium RIFCSPLOWO2_02_FULL_54_10]
MAKKGRIETGAVGATRWIGTTESLIAHTIIFAASFTFIFAGVSADTVLLVLTTIVSLEAIYLSIFIQMTVNRNTESLQEVEEDIDEIQEDVKELESGVGEISEDVEEISSDIDKIQEKDAEETQQETDTRKAMENIEQTMTRLREDIAALKQTQQSATDIERR